MALRVHDERLTRRVGAGVLVLAALIVLFVVTVLDRLGGGGLELRVHFGDPGALREGAPVMLAGERIGTLVRIRLDDRGGVVAIAHVDPDWARRIPINSEFFIGSRSILAPRYLEIGAPAHHAPPGRALVDGDEVQGIDPPNLDHLIARIYASLDIVQGFVDAIRPAAVRIDLAVDRLTGTVDEVVAAPRWHASIAQLTGAAEDAVADARTFTGTLDPAALARLIAHAGEVADRAGAALAALRADLDGVRAAAARAGAAVRVPDLAPTLATADSALARAQALLDDVHAAIADATTGDGAIAQLLADQELVDDVKELTKQMKRHPWQVAMPQP